jgi:uncharacterized protein (DUF433 family)
LARRLVMRVYIDWSGCDLVEIIPGKQGGVPLVKGTRIPVDTILEDVKLGASPEETHESLPSLPVDTIKKIRAFADSKQPVP